MSEFPDTIGERLRDVPGVGELLGALDDADPAWLVGGAVRDLLLGAEPVDVDVAVEGDAVAAAHQVAERLGVPVVEHERFGTATVETPQVSFNLAGTRSETYAHPGALPDVAPAGIDDDLRRRDFTINAIAASLSPVRLGAILDPHQGRDDLAAKLVRILHPESFRDDPTRLLRAVRYAARLGFGLEDQTEAAARDAVDAGALGTVSGPRIRDELLDLLSEPAAPDAVRLLANLGIDRALGLTGDPELVAGASLGAVETGAHPALSALAALGTRDADAFEPWVGALGLEAGERDAVVRAARSAPGLADALTRDLRPSELYRLLAAEPREALALALGLGAPGGPVLRYAGDLSGAQLQITGNDLLDAGVPESPAIGRALEATLDRVLDGEVHGRDEELQAALALARDGS